MSSKDLTDRNEEMYLQYPEQMLGKFYKGIFEIYAHEPLLQRDTIFRILSSDVMHERLSKTAETLTRVIPSVGPSSFFKALSDFESTFWSGCHEIVDFYNSLWFKHKSTIEREIRQLGESYLGLLRDYDDDARYLIHMGLLAEGYPFGGMTGPKPISAFLRVLPEIISGDGRLVEMLATSNGFDVNQVRATLQENPSALLLSGIREYAPLLKLDLLRSIVSKSTHPQSEGTEWASRLEISFLTNCFNKVSYELSFEPYSVGKSSKSKRLARTVSLIGMGEVLRWSAALNGIADLMAIDLVQEKLHYYDHALATRHLNCMGCGMFFVAPRRKGRKYCSDKCRTADHKRKRRLKD